MYILRRKLYTLYDDTDALKRMKDSDILAEEKRKNPGYGESALSAAMGAGVGAGIGATLNSGIKAWGTKGTEKSAIEAAKKGFKSGGKVGALVGGTIAGLSALNKRRGQISDNNTYNKRLSYAQKQAMRREKVDWKNNMTQRDGYSY